MKEEEGRKRGEGKRWEERRGRDGGIEEERVR